jgi:glucan phosphoethanolaminetransferase (alkaline phosphatase superfamily)
MNIFRTSSSWFFKEAPVPLRLLHIYIRGDAIVLAPFILVLLVIGIFSWQWMALLFGIFSAFRSLGEMIYWIHQQFGNKAYRPYDFGFHKLDNNAVYILYQLISLVLLVISTGFVLYLLLGWQ